MTATNNNKQTKPGVLTEKQARDAEKVREELQGLRNRQQKQALIVRKKKKTVLSQTESLRRYPLTSEAHKALKKRGKLFPGKAKTIKHEPVFDYLHTFYSHRIGHAVNAMFNDLCRIAVALGRQLTLDDLQFFFKDEGIQVCRMTGRKFHPLSWLKLKRPQIQSICDRIKNGWTLQKSVETVAGDLDWCGHFYPTLEGEVFCYSGTPFTDGIPPENSTGSNPLIQAYEIHQ
jgi:hypothetical protein